MMHSSLHAIHLGSCHVAVVSPQIKLGGNWDSIHSGPPGTSKELSMFSYTVSTDWCMSMCVVGDNARDGCVQRNRGIRAKRDC